MLVTHLSEFVLRVLRGSSDRPKRVYDMPVHLTQTSHKYQPFRIESSTACQVVAKIPSHCLSSIFSHDNFGRVAETCVQYKR
jgi:hypothetical protein